MRLIFVLGVVCLAPSALAQQSAAPPPRCEAPIYHQFDFWIGEWTVTNPAGQKVGESSITREEAGCLIVEHWKSGKGNAGQSYNFYDPAAKKWRQVWVAPSELTDYSGALNAGGEMVLEGLSQQAGGATQKSRGTWTANKDGTVRQRFSEWDPKKKAWVESFNGLYARTG
jgi:hypothetical protein